MSLLYHAYVYLEFLILACTIYILAPSGAIPANCASLLALLKRLISPISARILTAVMTFTPGIVVSVQPRFSRKF